MEKVMDNINVYKEVSYLKEYFIGKWWDTNKDFPKLSNKTDYWYKRNQEKKTSKFIDEFFKLIYQYPGDECERDLWKKRINDTIDDFAKESDLISMEDKNILFSQGMFKTTQKFVHEAREFDSSMDIADVGQAMRNVWIMNIISLLLEKKVELTPSIFSYSMLYPYTDNYLDDTGISNEEKIKLSDRFEKRLEGKAIEAKNKYEENIFGLVERIESEYDRSEYPEVFESLLSIHKAQIKSLLKQGKVKGPYERDILGISVEKGGTSVLADGYLVNGRLSHDEAVFFFGYGVLLQISDDLQDVKDDLEDGHMTIVSQLSEKWDLDNITNGLINFTHDLLENTECFDCPNIEDMKKLIKKNCIQLILFAVAKNRKLYSRNYYKRIKQYFPYRTRYMRKLYKVLKKKYSKLSKSYSGEEIEKMLMEALS